MLVRNVWGRYNLFSRTCDYLSHMLVVTPSAHAHTLCCLTATRVCCWLDLLHLFTVQVESDSVLLYYCPNCPSCLACLNSSIGWATLDNIIEMKQTTCMPCAPLLSSPCTCGIGLFSDGKCRIWSVLCIMPRRYSYSIYLLQISVFWNHANGRVLSMELYFVILTSRLEHIFSCPNVCFLLNCC